jgi:acyl dehydratase
MELPARERGPITKAEIAEYSAAAGDPNPMHVDEGFAKAAGYPGVFAQGMLSMGYLGQYLVDLFGVGSVKRLRARFAKITWPGDVVTCRGRVVRAFVEDGERLAEVEIATEAGGEQKLTGSAVVRLR